jgi:hypothetical protein
MHHNYNLTFNTDAMRPYLFPILLILFLISMLMLGNLFGQETEEGLTDYETLQDEISTARAELEAAARRLAELSMMARQSMPSDRILPRAMIGVVVANEGGDVIVERVSPGSPAQSAGVLPGDIITNLNGQSISDVSEVIDLMTELSPGDEVSLSVERDGFSATLNLVSVAMHPMQSMNRFPLLENGARRMMLAMEDDSFSGEGHDFIWLEDGINDSIDEMNDNLDEDGENVFILRQRLAPQLQNDRSRNDRNDRDDDRRDRGGDRDRDGDRGRDRDGDRNRDRVRDRYHYWDLFEYYDLVPVSPQLAPYFGVEQGLLVVFDDDHSLDGGELFHEGDVITGIEGESFIGLRDFAQKFISAIESDGSALIEITRDYQSQTVNFDLNSQ